MQNIKITDTYKNFYKLTINDNEIEVMDKTGDIKHMVSSNRILLEHGLFLKKEGDIIKYVPGSYDVNGNFYNHPVKLSDKLILVSLKEKDFYGRSTLGMSEEKQNEMINPKGIEITLYTIVDYEITPFIIFCNNRHGIFNAVRTLHYLRLFLQEGLKLEELNPDFAAAYTIRLMQRYTSDCYKRIFDFVSTLKFSHWSEASSRAGKDTRIESGVIIHNESKNKYFSYLLNKYTDFKSIGGNEFRGKNEKDYGYIPSGKYSENEMKESNSSEYRDEITTALIKNYDPTKEIIYHFYKN